MMKRCIFGIALCVLGLLVAVPAFSEQLSKVAVVNIDQIFESFPDDAEIYEELDLLRDEYEERKSLYTQLIDDLDREIDDAKSADDELEAGRLENERYDLLADLALYTEIMRRKLMDTYRQIAVGEGIVQDMLAAIARVAVDEGYSLVLEAGDSRLWWYSQQIVITDLVINRLRAIAR